MALVAFAACNERRSTYYADVAAARRDGAFDRGWLPSCLPQTAVRIREHHDLDTNEALVVFDVNVGERQKLQQHIREVSIAESRAWQIRKPTGLSEWPSHLVGTPDVEREGLRAYVCSDGTSDERLFIDWRRGRGFVWSSGS